MEDTKLERERKSLSQGDANDGGSSKASFIAGQDLLLLPLAGRHHGLLHTAGFLLSSPINLDTSIFSAGIKLLLSPPNTGCFPHSGTFPCSQPSLDFTFFIPNNNWVPHPCFSHVLWIPWPEGRLVGCSEGLFRAIAFLTPHVAIILCVISLCMFICCMRTPGSIWTTDINVLASWHAIGFILPLRLLELHWLTVCVCVGAGLACARTMTHVEVRRQFRKSVLFLCQLGPRDRTQDLRLGDKHWSILPVSTLSLSSLYYWGKCPERDTWKCPLSALWKSQHWGE